MEEENQVEDEFENISERQRKTSSQFSTIANWMWEDQFTKLNKLFVTF